MISMLFVIIVLKSGIMILIMIWMCLRFYIVSIKMFFDWVGNLVVMVIFLKCKLICLLFEILFFGKCDEIYEI